MVAILTEEPCFVHEPFDELELSLELEELDFVELEALLDVCCGAAD